jgi:hypothetical protein
MSPFSDFRPNEEILRQERLHPGIFALPVVLFVAFLIPTIPVIFFLNMMGTMIGQLNAQGPRSPLSILWLVLVSIDLLPALLYFIVILMAYQNSEITLTNKRLIYRTGFVARAAGELPLENVEALFILEPLLGRLLGYGTVTVSSIGGLRLPLRYLAKPQVFQAALQRAVAQAKSPPSPHTKLAPVPQDDSRYMPKSF